MWTVFIFLNLGVLHCTVSSSLPSPVNVFFSSVNLRNVLQWTPGNGTPYDTHFTVQYAIYGDSVEGSKGKRVNWREVRQCTETVRSWCDLSNETWDLEHGYYARVRAGSRKASSKWALTRIRFDPKLDTSFGPPLVSVDREDNTAIITLKGPMRYQLNNHTPAVSMATLYRHMSYNLSIHNKRRDQMSHFPGVSNPYKYGLMDYDTEYCFSAKSRFLSMPAQCHSSAWQCITTPQDPVIGQLQKVVVGIVVPTAFMCMLVVVGYILYHYLTGKGQKSPPLLNNPSFHPPPLTFPPDNPNVHPFSFIKDKPSEVESGISDPEWCIADPPPRYSPQRSNTPPEPKEPIDYGCVGPEIVSGGGEEGRESWRDRGGDGSNLRGEHQKCTAGDSYEKKEWRVEDGPSAGLYAPQAKSHTCSQSHTPTHTHAQTEVSTLVQARPFSPPQTGLFHIPFTEEGRMEEEMGRNGEIDGGVEGGGQSEAAPLLSAYASQNIRDPSDFLPDDYGVLRAATAHEIEEEEGTLCINWDPMTGKLVLPEMEMQFSREGELDGLMQGEEEREIRLGGEEEEVYVKKGELTLENVFVRQASEEEAEAKREMGRGEEVGDDILSKWNLVVSMDQ